jgi:D-alanyl-D-alanine carboxypeptidase
MSKLPLACASLLLLLASTSCGLTPSPSTTTSSPAESGASPMAATPDLAAPLVISQDPAAGGVLGASGTVRVTFSEPVRGVDRGSFQLSEESGSVLIATVTLDAEGRVATLTAAEGATLGIAYRVSLTSAIRDEAGNRLARTSWDLAANHAVSFAAGTYTGYQFGATTADLRSLKRAEVESSSRATATEFRELDGSGYLKIDAGIWQGYWVHGTRAGTALSDLAAPIPPLPACDYLDLPTARGAYADWATTVLDTVFLLPAGYAPGDLVDTSGADLNGTHLIRAIALPDLSAMVAAAASEGARLEVQSAYRSYAGQVLTFDGWVRQVGYDEALDTSARPGHSEHQLGTAIDFRTAGGVSPWSYADWGTTTEGAWLAANAWRFGWVMSYPKGVSAVSCYRYEPWHYRYVGRSTAAAVHEAGVTLREWLWSQGYGVR